MGNISGAEALKSKISNNEIDLKHISGLQANMYSELESFVWKETIMATHHNFSRP